MKRTSFSAHEEISVFTAKILTFAGFYCKKAYFGGVPVFIAANNLFIESFHDSVNFHYFESLYEVKWPQNPKIHYFIAKSLYQWIVIGGSFLMR